MTAKAEDDWVYLKVHRIDDPCADPACAEQARAWREERGLRKHYIRNGCTPATCRHGMSETTTVPRP